MMIAGSCINVIITSNAIYPTCSDNLWIAGLLIHILKYIQMIAAENLKTGLYKFSMIDL